MLEYRTEKCTPNDLDSTCQAMQVWGWKLEQTQEVYSENNEIVSNDTHLVGRQDIFGNYHDLHLESTPVTQKTVTHYISARFSRDKAMPNYKRICELEQEYYHPKEKSPKVKISEPHSNVGLAMKILFGGLFFGTGGIGLAISSGSTAILVCVIALLVIFATVCIVCAVKAHKTYKIAYEKYLNETTKNEKLVAEYEKRVDKRRDEILEEVLTLLPNTKSA